MAQPPSYERQKNFADDFGNETDHSALNAELDRASNSINDIRANLAILQADDGQWRPLVVTADTTSEAARVSLVEGVVMDAQAMLDKSEAASKASVTAAEKAKASEAASAASALAASTEAKRATDIADGVQAKADVIVQTANSQAQAHAEAAARSAQDASDSATQAQTVYGQIEERADKIVQTAASEAAAQAQVSAEYAGLSGKSAEEAKVHAEIANQRGIPLGTVVMFSGSTPPAGYLKCDGSAVGRETYPELFNAIGTTCGEGDGQTTFNLPRDDLKSAQAIDPVPVIEYSDYQGGDHPELTYRELLNGDQTIDVPENGIAHVYYKASTSTTGYVDINDGNGNYLYGFSVPSILGYGMHIVSIDVPVSKGNKLRTNLINGTKETSQDAYLFRNRIRFFKYAETKGCVCIKAFDAAVNPGLIDITELAQAIADIPELTAESITDALGYTPFDAASSVSGMQVFTASGNFTVPDGVNSVKVRAIGGGGVPAGAGGTSSFGSGISATGGQQAYGGIPAHNGTGAGGAISSNTKDVENFGYGLPLNGTAASVGYGGVAIGTVAVTSGQSIYVTVGGRGANVGGQVAVSGGLVIVEW